MENVGGQGRAISGLERRAKHDREELSDERKRLIQRYMDDWLEGAGRLRTADEPSAAERPTLHLAAAPDPDAPPARRRGRPPGGKKRRQVHFHVDADEDQMLRHAAGRFGSQQKAFIAALYALNDVLLLRDRVEVLESENASEI